MSIPITPLQDILSIRDHIHKSPLYLSIRQQVVLTPSLRLAVLPTQANQQLSES